MVRHFVPFSELDEAVEMVRELLDIGVLSDVWVEERDGEPGFGLRMTWDRKAELPLRVRIKRRLYWGAYVGKSTAVVRQHLRASSEQVRRQRAWLMEQRVLFQE
jgi:hypothetical protein